MAATNYADLMKHVGHDIETVTYGQDDNVAIECNTCYEVLLDYDKENN